MKRRRKVSTIISDFDKRMQSLAKELEQLHDSGEMSAKKFRKVADRYAKQMDDDGLTDELKEIKLGPEVMGQPLFYREKTR